MSTSTRNSRRRFMCVAAAIGLPSLDANSQPASSRLSADSSAALKVRIINGDKSIPVTLDKNDTARDFVALLPLSLTLEDYAATEKVATLGRKLATAGAPAGTTPAVGDFSYYAPWGNLAIFYKPFRYSAGLIRLGRIDNGVESLRVEGRIHVRIEVQPH